MSNLGILQSTYAVNRLKQLLPFLWACNVVGCDGTPHPGFPYKHARANQQVQNAYITAFVTGRGWGKTRAASEYVKARMLADSKHRAAIITTDFSAGRDVCIEGDSGLLSVLPPDRVKTWNRSMGQLVLANGAQLKLYGATTIEDAQALRGPQHHTLWFEELASIRCAQEAWDLGLIGNRLGRDPRVVVTTTPKPTPLIKALLNHKYPNTQIVTGSTYDNAVNLAEPFMDMLQSTYKGTRLGEQELFGLLLDAAPGALWSADYITVTDGVDPATLDRVVVGVDPPGSHRRGAEAGIVAVGRRGDMAYVLDDRSMLATPQQWSTKVIELYDKYKADVVVAERNYGGDMVEATIRGVDSSRHINVKLITSTRGKALRAEPVVNLYERGLVKHLSNFPELVQQMTSWVPPGQTEIDERGVERPVEPSNYSPDRLDALVFGISELLLSPKPTQVKMSMGL